MARVHVNLICGKHGIFPAIGRIRSRGAWVLDGKTARILAVERGEYAAPIMLDMTTDDTVDAVRPCEKGF